MKNKKNYTIIGIFAITTKNLIVTIRTENAKFEKTEELRISAEFEMTVYETNLKSFKIKFDKKEDPNEIVTSLHTTLMEEVEITTKTEDGSIEIMIE